MEMKKNAKMIHEFFLQNIKYCLKSLLFNSFSSFDSVVYLTKTMVQNIYLNISGVKLVIYYPLVNARNRFVNSFPTLSKSVHISGFTLTCTPLFRF